MGVTEKKGDVMKLMSYTATVAIACSSITVFLITSGVSMGGDKKTITANEERSKNNEEQINEIRRNLAGLDVTLKNIEKQLEKLAENKEKNDRNK